MSTNEGGTIPEENLAIYATDRVETTSQVWLGLTMGCARCHDHKFDPISTKDFYSMAAFFRNTTQPAMDKNVMDSPPILRMPRAEDAQRYAALPGEIDAAKKAYDSRVEAAEPAFETWQQTQGPADLPTIGDERLDFRLLSDAAEPTTLRNVVSPDRTFTFTGGKPRAVASPLGPAVRLPKGVTADLGDLGDVESDEPFSYGAWVQVTDTVDGALLARMDIANGYRGWDLYMKGSRAGGTDHQLLEPGRPARGGGARRASRKDGITSSSPTTARARPKASRSTTTARPRTSTKRWIRFAGPSARRRRCGSTGAAPARGPEGAAVHDIRFYRSGALGPGGAGARPPRRARSGARREAERADQGTAEAPAGLLPRLPSTRTRCGSAMRVTPLSPNSRR